MYRMFASIVPLIDFVLRQLMFPCRYDPFPTGRLGKTMFLVSIGRTGIVHIEVEPRHLRRDQKCEEATSSEKARDEPRFAGKSCVSSGNAWL